MPPYPYTPFLADADDIPGWFKRLVDSGFTAAGTLVSGLVFDNSSAAVMTANVAALQQAISNSQTLGYGRSLVIAAPPTTPASGNAHRLYLNAGITLDVSTLVRFDATGCVLDFSAMTSGVAVAITGSAISPGEQFYRQTLCEIIGLNIVGPGIGSSVDGIASSGGSSNQGAAYVNFRGLFIDGFGKGFHVNSNTCYLVKFYEAYIYNCTAGFQIEVFSNVGENYAFFGSVIGNNTTAFVLNQTNCDVNLFGCSVDYNTNIVATNANNCHLKLVHCHIEFNATGNDQILLNGDAASFQMYGGMFFFTGSPPAPWAHLVNVSNANAYFILDSVQCNNLNSSGSGITLATGAGFTHFRGTNQGLSNVSMPYQLSDGAVNNCLADPGFEVFGAAGKARFADLFTLTLDGAAFPTNQVTGTNISIAFSNAAAHSGSWSLKASKLGAAAVNARFALLIPVLPGQRPSATWWQMTPAGGTGFGAATITYSTKWYKLWGLDANFVPSFAEGSTNLTAVTAAWPNSFTQVGIKATPSPAPTWANYFVIEWDLVNAAINTIGYLDDFVVNIF